MEKAILCVFLTVLLCQQLMAIRHQALSLRELKMRGMTGSRIVTLPLDEAERVIETRLRSRRAVDQSGGTPIIHGSHSFQDSNQYASIHYSGSSSPVILVLTYTRTQQQPPTNVHLYRSENYGANFSSILDQLDSSNPHPSLWSDFFVSPINKNMIVINHATDPILYISMNEGLSWTIRNLPRNINPRSFVWNAHNDRMALAHGTQSNQLYVTQDLGTTWTKIADNVDSPLDYQWGDPSVDPDNSVVFFNTYDPSDVFRNNFTVSLKTQRFPYNNSTLQTFDPSLGKHDQFLLLGRYIFSQKTDSQGVISLHISYDRHPFKKAMIPATDPHQNYIVSHINQQQAMVIVEHASTQFNLYLSDVTGVYFSLSLPDIVNDGSIFDLELVEGVNGTLLANQYVRVDPSEPRGRARSLISLDNGGYWDLVRGPVSEDCIPPQCSLHFNMATSAFFRTGIYSQASAPGIVLAHGNVGSDLDSSSPDLYISRDGGVNWFRTLEGSWGVTVVDHGGLLVAARDYHPPPSTQLRYSCDEGMSWKTFNFTATSMTVYGVLTEPGEHTTTVSLYGLKVNTRTWDVVTVNFSSIFPSVCSPSDYYYWHPWDDRTDEECVLGGTVTIERRNASRCCLIGQDYSRPIQFNVCPCFEDDFECDYGYQHADGFTGPCVRDESIILPDPCSSNETTYSRSQGYRKVAGDVCKGGEEDTFGSVEALCCDRNNPCKTQCHYATCQMTTPTSYGCVCWSGYTKRNGGQNSTCYDVDECHESSVSPCSERATCINTAGSFHCRCNLSYVGDGFNCYSIRDCPRMCDAHATCSAQSGVYVCHCPHGFTGDGYKDGSGCADIDECVAGPCVDGAECTNYDGGFTCACPPGYLGDGLPSGSGCSVGQIAGPTSSGPPIAVIVVGVLLALAVLAILLLLTLLILKQVELRRVRGRRSAAEGIHYRNAEDEQPLTWSNPQVNDDDDDDEPLLT